MKTSITIQLRQFPVTLRDERTGEEVQDTITLDKPRLTALGSLGKDHKSLIYELYNRKGYRVLEIGAARKVTATVELDALTKPDRTAAPPATGYCR